MYRKMLVPLDGSELAEEVLVYAKELAGRLDIDVDLLHISNPASEALKPMEEAYIEHIAESFRKQVEAVQQKTGQGKAKPINVKAELLVGYAAEAILQYADKDGVDLILLASHGRSGIKRWTIGSVAGKVMSATKIPVWLIKSVGTKETPYDKWTNQTLIVSLDGSELAESILPHAEVLTKQRGDTPIDVVLVRVAEPLNIPTYYSPDISGVTLNWGNFIQQETQRRKQAAKEYLAKIEEQLKNKGITVRSVVIEGRPTDEVVEFVNKTPNSMIIMATHGRSGLSRLVYGSVAANVLNGVTRPMFIIKP
jgi:nucleotide-binding universal stress UspA family protein